MVSSDDPHQYQKRPAQDFSASAPSTLAARWSLVTDAVGAPPAIPSRSRAAWRSCSATVALHPSSVTQSATARRFSASCRSECPSHRHSSVIALSHPRSAATDSLMVTSVPNRKTPPYSHNTRIMQLFLSHRSGYYRNVIMFRSDIC